MRFSRLYFLTHNLIDTLTIKMEKDGNSGRMKILNIGKINSSLDILKSFPYFQEEFDRLMKHASILEIFADYAIVDSSTAFYYQSEVMLIQKKLKLITLLYKDFAPQLDEDTLCISAPQNMSLPELNSFVGNTTKALNMLSNMPGLEGQISFKSVEYGSDWFYYIVEGATLLAGIKLILKIAKSIVIESYTTFKTMKAIDLIHDSNVTLHTIQKRLAKMYINNEETFSNLSPEDTERIVQATILLATEISNGAKAEIYLLNQAKSESETLIEKQIASCADDLKLLKENTTSNEQE